MAVGLAAPHTFAASACPALFGILYCVYRRFPIRIYEAAMLFAACVLMQSSVNTLNDYMDFVSGADTAEDNVEKSDSIIVFSDLAPWRALALGCGYLAAALLIGSYFVFRRGPAPLIIGVIGALVVVLYSAGPLPVSHLPIGEIVSGVGVAIGVSVGAAVGVVVGVAVGAGVSVTAGWEDVTIGSAASEDAVAAAGEDVPVCPAS